MCTKKYRKHDPGSASEEEIVENLFFALASAVSYFPNHKRFDELEGMQLMLIFIRFVEKEQKNLFKNYN